MTSPSDPPNVQEGPKTAQKSPETAQEGPRRTKKALELTPEELVETQTFHGTTHLNDFRVFTFSSLPDGPSALRNRPKTASEGLQIAQEGPTMASI